MFAILLAGWLGTAAATAEEVTATRIASNRATIFFNKVLPNFSSFLSDDKRTLTLTFGALDIPDSLRHILAKSGINEAYWQMSKSAVKLFLRFDEKQGYSVARQPFSRSLEVDVFRWSELTPAEDAYRSGLLAEESGADESSVSLYEKAYEGGIAAAALRLGVRAAIAGDVGQAADWLEKARAGGVRSPEMTAVSAYLAQQKGDERGAESLADRYTRQTGLRLIFDKVGDFPPPVSGTLEGEPLPVAAALDEEINPNAKPSTPAAASTADLDKRFAKLFSDEKQPENKSPVSSQSSFIPAWAKTGSLAAAAFFCTGGFYIGFMYFRWRSSRLKHRKGSVKSGLQPSHSPEATFEEELQSAALAQSASAAYAAASPTAIDLSIDDSIPDERDETPAPQPAPVRQKRLPSSVRKTPAKSSSERYSRDIQENHSEIDSLAGIFPPGEVQLAMRLHSQRRAHKTAALESFSGGDVPNGSFRLSQTARSLGVEQSGLELKQALEGNNEHIARLYQKFGARMN